MGIYMYVYTHSQLYKCTRSWGEPVKIDIDMGRHAECTQIFVNMLNTDEYCIQTFYIYVNVVDT